MCSSDLGFTCRVNRAIRRSVSSFASFACFAGSIAGFRLQRAVAGISPNLRRCADGLEVVDFAPVAERDPRRGIPPRLGRAGIRRLLAAAPKQVAAAELHGVELFDADWLNLNPAMEPAKHAKHTKEETLRQVDRLTHWVNPAKVTTPSFRVLSRLSRAIHSRF